MHPTPEKILGVLTIVVGLGIIIAVIAGLDVWPIAAIVSPLIVIAWAVYHFVFIRPAPTGVMRPEESPPHHDD